MDNKTHKLFLWLIAGVSSSLPLLSVYYDVILLDNKPSFESKRFTVYIVLVGVLISLWMSWLWTIIQEKSLPSRLTEKISNYLRSRSQWFRIIIILVVSLIPVALFLFTPLGLESWPFSFRLYIVVILGLFVSMLIAVNDPQKSFLIRWIGGILIIGAVYTAFRWLNQITNYPFSLTWSEGNRYWDYSILFGSSRYLLSSGESFTPAISLGRQFLWAIPFLYPKLTIGMMRVWDSLLWIVPSLFLGWISINQDIKDRFSWKKILFSLWVFVFLAQGPIYAPILLAAILIVWAIKKKLWFAIIITIIASYYGYISRWTWMFGPGLWAAMLTLLEIDPSKSLRNDSKHYLKPLLLGISGYFGATFLPKIINNITSGFENPVNLSIINIPASSPLSLHQPLLWARLFPNSTFPLGIIGGMLWAGLPLCCFLIWMVIKKFWCVNRTHVYGMLFVTFSFIIVGVVISVKIGGGSNLHNLDQLWITLALICAKAANKINLNFDGWRNPVSCLLLCLTIIGPVSYSLQFGYPVIIPSEAKISQDLEKIRELVYFYNDKGSVLFLDQRQLLTFGYLKDIPLISSYEKKIMMDMAMAERMEYFGSFYQDLDGHRFAAIVSEILKDDVKLTGQENFPEENNAWVKWVSTPILKYYKPVWTFEDVGVQILIPRE